MVITVRLRLKLWLFAHPDQPQLASQKYARSINLHHSDCYASHLFMFIFKLLLGSIIISCNITHVHKTNKNESNFFKWCSGACIFPLYTTSTYAITAPSRIKWYAAPKYCNVALAISYPTILACASGSFSFTALSLCLISWGWNAILVLLTNHSHRFIKRAAVIDATRGNI